MMMITTYVAVPKQFKRRTTAIDGAIIGAAS